MPVKFQKPSHTPKPLIKLKQPVSKKNKNGGIEKTRPRLEACRTAIYTKSGGCFLIQKKNTIKKTSKKKKRPKKQPFLAKYMESIDTLSVNVVTRNMSKHYNAWMEYQRLISEGKVNSFSDKMQFPDWCKKTDVATRGMQRTFEMYENRNLLEDFPDLSEMEQALPTQESSNSMESVALEGRCGVQTTNVMVSRPFSQSQCKECDFRPIITRSRKMELRAKMQNYLHRRSMNDWQSSGDSAVSSEDFHTRPQESKSYNEVRKMAAPEIGRHSNTSQVPTDPEILKRNIGTCTVQCRQDMGVQTENDPEEQGEFSYLGRDYYVDSCQYYVTNQCKQRGEYRDLHLPQSSELFSYEENCGDEWQVFDSIDLNHQMKVDNDSGNITKSSFQDNAGTQNSSSMSITEAPQWNYNDDVAEYLCEEPKVFGPWGNIQESIPETNVILLRIIGKAQAPNIDEKESINFNRSPAEKKWRGYNGEIIKLHGNMTKTWDKCLKRCEDVPVSNSSITSNTSELQTNLGSFYNINNQEHNRNSSKLYDQTPNRYQSQFPPSFPNQVNNVSRDIQQKAKSLCYANDSAQRNVDKFGVKLLYETPKTTNLFEYNSTFKESLTVLRKDSGTALKNAFQTQNEKMANSGHSASEPLQTNVSTEVEENLTNASGKTSFDKRRSPILDQKHTPWQTSIQTGDMRSDLQNSVFKTFHSTKAHDTEQVQNPWLPNTNTLIADVISGACNSITTPQAKIIDEQRHVTGSSTIQKLEKPTLQQASLQTTDDIARNKDDWMVRRHESAKTLENRYVTEKKPKLNESGYREIKLKAQTKPCSQCGQYTHHLCCNLQIRNAYQPEASTTKESSSMKFRHEPLDKMKTEAPKAQHFLKNETGEQRSTSAIAQFFTKRVKSLMYKI